MYRCTYSSKHTEFQRKLLCLLGVLHLGFLFSFPAIVQNETFTVHEALVMPIMLLLNVQGKADTVRLVSLGSMSASWIKGHVEALNINNATAAVLVVVLWGGKGISRIIPVTEQCICITYQLCVRRSGSAQLYWLICQVAGLYYKLKGLKFWNLTG